MNLSFILKVLPQYLIPHHFLSRLMAWLTYNPNKIWRKLFIKCIVWLYKVNLAEAKQPDIQTYDNFNAFFTRELSADARPLNTESTSIVSPADGVFSQLGDIENGQIFQAKGKHFSTLQLLGGDEQLAQTFDDGKFATIYLSPRDYHRLHMPVSGTLQEMLHIPGKLFSVNQTTCDGVPELFARNERVVCVFSTEIGYMALVLVGAIFVNSIETTWHGVVTPPSCKQIRRWQYQDKTIVINKGDEMGRFNMGSTIIVLFSKNKMQWTEQLQAESAVQLREKIGVIAS